MPFCANCGTELVENAKFCQKCGNPTKRQMNGSIRQQEFVGKIYKCPSCGEILKSFETICPACGLELRGTRAPNAVKEFALKLEAIESKREYEKPGFFAFSDAQTKISKTDEQKISLIKSFSVPNTKEDMLEFMILATSSMNMKTYDSSNTSVTKSEKEITEAWFSKVQQVYEKANSSFSSDETFTKIKALYDNCNDEKIKTQKKGKFKSFWSWGWIPLGYLILIVYLAISLPINEAKENDRLENIVVEVQAALDNEEYKHALRIADSIEYQLGDKEYKRKWEIEREHWIDKVIEEAEKNGVTLEHPQDKPIDDESPDDEANSYGDKKGIQSSIDSIKESIDEFNSIMNGENGSLDNTKN